jgi:hypothetical protein
VTANDRSSAYVIYRKQIRPVIVHGTDVMDRIFPGRPIPDP